MIKIYSAQINDFTQADYTKMYSLLDCAIKQKIDAKAKEIDKKRSLAGYILLWRGARELYGVTDVSLRFNNNGKPDCDFCFFNISHSENHIVCAFCDSNIGVDIQKIKSVKPREKYKYFNEQECCYVNQNKRLLSERYIEIFTKKEAAIKMLGLSLANASEVDVFSNKFYFKSEKYDGYIFTICTLNDSIV